jgi:hypothetical protein
MRMQTADRTNDRAGALAEVAKVRDTAEKLANGDYPEQADHIRVLAGLIGQLAEQVERLVPEGAGSTSNVATVEEDMTPETAPAEPMNDRAE